MELINLLLAFQVPVFTKRGSATPTHSRSARCRSFGASSQKFAEKTKFHKVLVKRAKRMVVRHPKFYFIDPGIFHYLRPGGPLDRPEEMEGAALEGLVAQHIRAWLEYGSSSSKLYYWHTKAGSEVDFIIYGEDGFWAVEVKNSLKVHPRDMRALNSFNLDYPECTPILIYRGKETLKINNITCLPCETFLKNLAPSNKKLLQGSPDASRGGFLEKSPPGRRR